MQTVDSPDQHTRKSPCDHRQVHYLVSTAAENLFFFFTLSPQHQLFGLSFWGLTSFDIILHCIPHHRHSEIAAKMAWFKKLALFIITVLPCTTAAPVVDTASQPVFETENRYIITLQNNLSPTEFRTHLSRISAVQYRNSLGRKGQSFAGIQNTYTVGDFRAYSGAFDEDTMQIIRNDSKASTRAPGCLPRSTF